MNEIYIKDGGRFINITDLTRVDYEDFLEEMLELTGFYIKRIRESEKQATIIDGGKAKPKEPILEDEPDTLHEEILEFLKDNPERVEFTFGSKSGWHKYASDKFYRRHINDVLELRLKPLTMITEDNFPDHWNKERWVWDLKLTASKQVLRDYIIDTSFPVKTIGADYSHAALENPRKDDELQKKIDEFNSRLKG